MLSFLLTSFSKMSDSQIYEADKDFFVQIHLFSHGGRNLKTQENHAVYSPEKPKRPFVEGLDVNM